ncbi:hypothetical protein [Microbacterium sp. NPDC091662]|uniref:hypothetical protein n=1 Tax=Microbacterium sp. NPDC091662 TaxID=3364211 RepID=UPI0038023A6E
MPSISKQLAEYLEPLLPETWDLYTVEATLGNLARPAVLLSYVSSSVQFAGPMPLGKRYEIQVTYVSPVTSSMEAADDDLWDAEQTVEAALQQLPFAELTSSQRATYGRDSEDQPTNWAHTFALQIGIPYDPNPEPAIEPDDAPEEE